MARVYVCLDDIVLLKQVMDMSMEEQDLKIVGITTSIPQSATELIQQDADIFIMRYAIDQQKAKYLLEEIALSEALVNLQIVMMFDEMDSDVFQLMAQYDLHTFLAKPYNPHELMEAIHSKNRYHKLVENGNWTSESVAGRILEELGLPAHLKGYNYLRTAAILFSQQEDPLQLKMGTLYAMVAKVHATTQIRVEKCMRTAIAYAYRHCPELICVYNTKPTCSQIIHYVSEHLKLTMLTY